jgi:hypothetical protein
MGELFDRFIEKRAAPHCRLADLQVEIPARIGMPADFEQLAECLFDRSARQHLGRSTRRVLLPVDPIATLAIGLPNAELPGFG